MADFPTRHVWWHRRVYVGVWTIQWLGGSFQDSHCGMDVPHKNYKKTPFDHGTVHGTYRVYTGCRQVAGLPFSCVFFLPPATGKHGWDGVVASLNTMPGTSWCYIANRVELGGSVMYNVVKTKKTMPQSSPFLYCRFLWLPSKTGLVYFCFTHPY